MGNVKVEVTIHPFSPSLITSVVEVETISSSTNHISLAGGLLELVLQLRVTFEFKDTCKGPFINTFEGTSKRRE